MFKDPNLPRKTYLQGRGFQAGLKGHQSENLALMGTMRPLFKNRKKFLVIAKKYWSQFTMCFLRGLKTILLHLQVDKLWGVMSM